MGKRIDRNNKHNKRKAWEVSRKSLLAIIPILFSLLVGAFYLGAYFMEAKKDREMLHWENEMETHHREELWDRENERDSWKEKYFQSLIERTETNVRSP